MIGSTYSKIAILLLGAAGVVAHMQQGLWSSDLDRHVQSNSFHQPDYSRVGPSPYDAASFNPISSLSALSDEFAVLGHPAFPSYSVRIKKSDFCDGAVAAYTGYIDVQARHLFFYFFESRSNPDKDDVLFWTNGGPGGSSAMGLFMELEMENIQVIKWSLNLSLEALRPPPLVEQNPPPSAITIANMVDQSVMWNMKRTLEANVHYENQLYGADNSYLHSCFPVHRRFSVIPQAVLRTVPNHILSGVDWAKLSTGSTRNTYYGRGSKVDQQKQYPDFLVVKVIPTDSKVVRQHFICSVIEFYKLNDPQETLENIQVDIEPESLELGNLAAADDAEMEEVHDEQMVLADLEPEVLMPEPEHEGPAAPDVGHEAPHVEQETRIPRTFNKNHAQMIRYMNVLKKHAFRRPDLWGYLLEGSQICRYWLRDDKVQFDNHWTPICEGNDELTVELCQIASEERNRDDVSDFPSSPPVTREGLSDSE